MVLRSLKPNRKLVDDNKGWSSAKARSASHRETAYLPSEAAATLRILQLIRGPVRSTIPRYFVPCTLRLPRLGLLSGALGFRSSEKRVETLSLLLPPVMQGRDKWGACRKYLYSKRLQLPSCIYSLRQNFVRVMPQLFKLLATYLNVPPWTRRVAAWPVTVADVFEF